MIYTQALSIALLLVPLSVNGLKLNCPVSGTEDPRIRRNGPAVFTWVVEEGDPELLTFELRNDQTLDTFEFARGTPITADNVTIQMEDVPGNDNYYMQATSGGFYDVVGTSPMFSVSGLHGFPTWGPSHPTKTGSPIARCSSPVGSPHHHHLNLCLVGPVAAAVFAAVFALIRRGKRRAEARRIQLPITDKN
ncbi:hypothetical protein C8J56DRAFT_911120 [Mycena floridula]|nr:hypothetical protein C8J56DRAFT_911120 [Mycena floridula]